MRRWSFRPNTAGISLYRDNLYVMPIFDVQNHIQKVEQNVIEIHKLYRGNFYFVYDIYRHCI